MSNWWFNAFPAVPYEKAPPGEKQMLTLLAYDISDLDQIALLGAEVLPHVSPAALVPQGT